MRKLWEIIQKHGGRLTGGSKYLDVSSFLERRVPGESAEFFFGRGTSGKLYNAIQDRLKEKKLNIPYRKDRQPRPRIVYFHNFGRDRIALMGAGRRGIEQIQKLKRFAATKPKTR